MKKQDYFGRFETLEKRKTLLIVDDLQQDRERFSKLAGEFPLHVLVAEGVQEGTKKALSLRPEFIFTDKDMPDGTGNDLAQAVRDVYTPIIVGFTAGNPEQFNQDYFAVTYSKSVTNEEVKGLLELLLDGKVPVKIDKKKINYIFEYFTAVDILAQGYLFSQQINRGEQPIPGQTFDLVPQERIDGLFASEIEGITDVDYRQNLDQLRFFAFQASSEMLEAVEELASPLVTEFLGNVQSRNTQAITEDQVTTYHQAYTKVMEAYQEK